MSAARERWIGTLIVLAAASLFASLGVASRVAYDAGLDAFAFVTWRAGLGAVILGVAVAARRGGGAVIRELLNAPPAAKRWLLLAAVLGAGLNLAIFLAFQRTTVALALLSLYTYPAMVAATSVLIGRERLDRGRTVALALALAGMAAVVLGSLDPSSSVRFDLIGIGMALVAALFQTVFMTFSRGYASIPTEQAMTAILAGSGLVAAVVSLATGGLEAILLPFASPGLLGLLVAVGLFGAAVPSVLFLTGIRRIGSVRTGILMLFEPVVGVALAAIFLAERLSPVQAAGGATILLAAYLVQRGISPMAEGSAIGPAPGGP